MQVQTRVDVFEQIFLVFLGLGTLVGVVVVAYTLYNAYKYRDGAAKTSDDDTPVLGELPTGGEGGKKLFLSFGLSAIVVISLVIWTYGMLLYVEDPGDDIPQEDAIEVDVEGDGFAWYFEYENGAETVNTMTVPEDTPVWISVTGGDVWHAFGISDLRVKADAIPGETDETWFMAEEAGDTHTIECFELCGDGHSAMDGTLEVVEEEEFEEFLEDEAPDDDENGDDEEAEDENGDDEANDEENGDDEADEENGDDEANDEENGDDEADDEENGDDEDDEEEETEDENDEEDDGGDD
ncbi:cytochrome c oxidase subunit II [Natronococcus sp.]|uniref:cytochrome c oxidase subunit II n=1 Tax=Natronococcus sp. TaxID=35747 RepID=UPI0025DBE07B|nr:cytochrome c oxidase subunit II [Natronococcus sp.]